MQKRDNIILIGFMATGKTAVGQKLARKLKAKYVSTDTLIEKKAKKKIKTIFAEKGEQYFRGLETQALLSLKDKKGLVVSCGGGIVLKPGNRALLRKLGKVIWLKAGPDTINKRLGPLKQRPLLNIRDKEERVKTIKRMLSSRNPLYEKSAHISIDTDPLPLAKVASQIASMI